MKVAFAALLLSTLATDARADFISLITHGSEYTILFEGGGGNTLQITNVTSNGSIGVGNTGQATDSGPSTINGRIDFSATNTSQFSNNNGSNVITGGVHYNVGDVATALSSANSLSQTLLGDAGANIAINGTMTINASAGNTFTVGGQTVHVFDATTFKNGGGDVLTINGSATDLVAINLDGLGNIQFHGRIAFTGGITADNVVFNVGGGDYTTLSGAASLDINNNGGKDGPAQGIFLDPNGAIDITNAVVFGRVFGGDSHDYQFVSGANITAPSGGGGGGSDQGSPVPEPTSILLLGSVVATTVTVLRKKSTAS